MLEIWGVHTHHCPRYFKGRQNQATFVVDGGIILETNLEIKGLKFLDRFSSPGIGSRSSTGCWIWTCVKAWLFFTECTMTLVIWLVNYFGICFIVVRCVYLLLGSAALGLLNYGRPFFPIDCLLSPSLKRHLLQILLYIFQPSQSRYSPSSSLRFTLKYFLNSPSMIHSYYMSNPFHCFLFNICYYA